MHTNAYTHSLTATVQCETVALNTKAYWYGCKVCISCSNIR